MTKKERTAEIRREIAELDIQEHNAKQFISGITSRKHYLNQELDRMGATSSARKGYELPIELQSKLRAGLTR